jgi:hypothetical protein
MAAEKTILRFILCVAVLFYLPTPYFLFPDNYPQHLSLYRVTRVGPALLIFAAMFYLILLRAYNTLTLQKKKVIITNSGMDEQ